MISNIMSQQSVYPNIGARESGCRKLNLLKQISTYLTRMLFIKYDFETN